MSLKPTKLCAAFASSETARQCRNEGLNDPVATIPPAFLDEIRTRLDLSYVVGTRVKLQRKGREWTACSPFHNEKTPSFYVNNEKGFYHCFGCGQHGDHIGFVMNHDGQSFLEAVETLAAQAGLDMPKADPDAARKAERAKGLKEAMVAAVKAYQDALFQPEGEGARVYIERRGLSPETVKHFGLGYSPDARDWLFKKLIAQGFSAQVLIDAALAKAPDDGRAPFDMFRGRLMFPIWDRQGNPVAFGGRILGDGEPKYLNSPDTPIFHKGQLLYGHHLARKAAHDRGEILVVEGYMDAIALGQAGVANAVAPLGTALTEDHLRLLWKMVPSPTVCLDGDAAGQRAARRTAERALPLLTAGKSVKFATLPQGQDPDDLLKHGGLRALQTVLTNSESLAAALWRWERAAMSRNDAEQRAALWSRINQALRAVEDSSLNTALEADMIARFEASFGHHPFRKGGGRQWERAKSGYGAPRSSGLKRPGGGLNAPGNDRVSVLGTRSLSRRPYEILFHAFMNHPDLLDLYGENLATLTMLDVDLAQFRDALVQALFADVPLDSATLQAHLSRHGLDSMVERLTGPEIQLHAGFAKPDAQKNEVIEGLETLFAGFTHRDMQHELQVSRSALPAYAVTDEELKALSLRAKAYTDAKPSS